MRTRASKLTLVIVFGIAVLALGVISIARVFKKEAPLPTPPQVEIVVPKVTHKVVGKSVEGRTLDAYIFGTGETHLLFVGGIHGGYEWNSSALAYQFIDYLKENPTFVPKNITIGIIPSANPDGVYRIVEKEGPFTSRDIPTATHIEGTGRFNAHNVDLNRNFDCKWKPTSTWKNKIVSAGTSAFSEPEAVAIRDFVSEFTPSSVVFWHSKANAVYASECTKGILPATLDIMNAYSRTSGYGAVKSFDAYEISGDAEGWLASINIPAITVEMRTHETVEWEQNLAGVRALLNYYKR